MNVDEAKGVRKGYSQPAFIRDTAFVSGEGQLKEKDGLLACKCLTLPSTPGLICDFPGKKGVSRSII